MTAISDLNAKDTSPSLIDILHYECVSLLISSPSSSLYTDFFTKVQTKLQCCGCVAPADYSKLHQPALPESCYSADGEVHKTGCLPTYYQVQIYNVHCTQYSVQYTMYIVHGTVYSIQCTLYTVHYTLYLHKNFNSFKFYRGIG